MAAYCMAMPDAPGAVPYAQVQAQPRYPSLEEQILAFWREDRTFEASVALHPAETEYVFYDGPPFANGLPHYGHLLTGFVKDAVPRYQTMRGHRVERRFGWDCHGLPAEMEAEKELGVADRQAVIAYGIDRFNDYCRQIVQRTTDAWERYVTRQARWVDFEDDYKTMDLSFMESVLWAFKRLYDKGLAYEGFRVLPYCWECETPLSNFETRQDDAYRDRTDPAVTVRFDLEPVDGGPELLRGPVGAAGVDDDAVDLAVQPRARRRTRPRVRGARAGTARRVVIGAARARGLRGRARRRRASSARSRAPISSGAVSAPCSGYFADTPGAFVVLGEDFVAIDEGTGIVQMAPGFGEDDQRACEAAGIPVVCPVDDRARFTAEVPRLRRRPGLRRQRRASSSACASAGALAPGRGVHPQLPPLLADRHAAHLPGHELLVRAGDRHQGPHGRAQPADPAGCPSTSATAPSASGWRGRGTGRSAGTVSGGRRSRCGRATTRAYPRIDVYGSLDELAADFGVRPTDLHRPAIDELTRPNPDDPTGASTMRRIPDVLDCWFESGSMPFAQLHYPFENAKRFEEHFPADFIVEYVGQTRGWFYTLHVLATALVRPAAVQDLHRARHRARRRRPQALQAAAQLPRPGGGLRRPRGRRHALVPAQLAGAARPRRRHRGQGRSPSPSASCCNPIWNTWYFLSLYANADGLARAGPHRPDRRARPLRPRQDSPPRRGRDRRDGQLRPGRGDGRTSPSFLDALTNWYVRRSRDRFWRPVDAGAPAAQAPSAGPVGPPDDKQDAYDTLHTVLEVLCRVAAPFLPFLSEAVYQGLTGERSVHLRPWPDADELPADPELVEAMDLAREVCSAGHSIRKAAGRRARLPLSRLTVAAPGASRLLPVRRPDRRRGERAAGRAASRPSASWPRRCSTSSRPRSGRGSARAPSRSSPPPARATGPGRRRHGAKWAASTSSGGRVRPAPSPSRPGS